MSSYDSLTAHQIHSLVLAEQRVLDDDPHLFRYDRLMQVSLELRGLEPHDKSALKFT